MYEIILSKNAQKQLQKLEQGMQERIISVLERARIRPEAHFSKLVGENAYKLRAGDYRAIADIDPQNARITVHKIGHRKNIYDF